LQLFPVLIFGLISQGFVKQDIDCKAFALAVFKKVPKIHLVLEDGSRLCQS
jgi:hypothetical protein